MAGGQPISIKNLKELRALTKKHGIRIIHDMTRVAENAYFIQAKGKRI
jgi:tyrosine phenol-lyase